MRFPKAELLDPFKVYEGGKGNTISVALEGGQILTSTFINTASSSWFLAPWVLRNWARFTSYLTFMVLVSSIRT